MSALPISKLKTLFDNDISVSNYPYVKPEVLIPRLHDIVDSVPNDADTNRRTLSGDISLAASDKQVQNIDPNGAARNVDLPPEENGLRFVIGNRAGAANAITVRDNDGATLATVNQDDVAVCISDGTGWIVQVGAGAVT